MEAYGLPAPVFENRRDEFVVTLYNTPMTTETTSSSTNTADALLDFCKTPRSRKEIADFLKLKTTTYAMQRYVTPLLESGKLKMTNPEHPGSRAQKYHT